MPYTSALTGSVADGRKDFVSVHYRAESVGLAVKRIERSKKRLVGPIIEPHGGVYLNAK